MTSFDPTWQPVTSAKINGESGKEQVTHRHPTLISSSCDDHPPRPVL